MLLSVPLSVFASLSPFVYYGNCFLFFFVLRSSFSPFPPFFFGGGGAHALWDEADYAEKRRERRGGNPETAEGYIKKCSCILIPTSVHLFTYVDRELSVADADRVQYDIIISKSSSMEEGGRVRNERRSEAVDQKTKKKRIAKLAK